MYQLIIGLVINKTYFAIYIKIKLRMCELKNYIYIIWYELIILIDNSKK